MACVWIYQAQENRLGSNKSTYKRNQQRGAPLYLMFDASTGRRCRSKPNRSKPNFPLSRGQITNLSSRVRTLQSKGVGQMWHTLRRTAKELEPLRGIRVQGNNKIVVIDSLVNEEAVRRLLPKQQ